MLNPELSTLGKFLVDEIWTRGRINYVIVECELAQWETVKDAWEKDAKDIVTKKDLKAFVDDCRDNYIEPIPCVRLFSHCWWLFHNGAYQDLRESPQHLHNYNVTNPRTHQLIDQLLDEVIALFQPQYLHVGHDEIDCGGTVPFPWRPENIKLGTAELFYLSVSHLHDFLASRGVKMMIWHDSIMAPGEVFNGHGMRLEKEEIKKFRTKLPKDIIIMLWEYSQGQHYEEIGTLQQEGFTVVGCPWYGEDNALNMTAAVKREGAWGVCGTTWWGPFAGWKTFENDFYQIEPHLRIGSWSWGSENKTAFPVSRYADILANLLFLRNQQDNSVKTGRLVNLDQFANYYPQKDDPMLQTDVTQAFCPNTRIRVGRSEFLVPGRENRLAVVMLRSYPDASLFPEEIKIPVSGKINQLYLLGCMAGLLPDYQTPVLKVCFEYTNKKESTQTLCYNTGINHIQGRANLQFNDSNNVQAGNGRIWASACLNPEPGEEVAAIRLISIGKPYLLFGMSFE